jgi:hypothetical protein
MVRSSFLAGFILAVSGVERAHGQGQHRDPSEAATHRPEAPPTAPSTVRDVHPNVRLSWLILQTIPSPGLAVGERGGHGMMSWQITPFLYSWAMDSRLVPFRYFVVEPLIRQSGSVEWFVSPLYIGRGNASDNVGVRTGARAYFPITERGDGASPSLDAGIYTLFGGLGLLATVSPWFKDDLFELSLRLRYF